MYLLGHVGLSILGAFLIDQFLGQKTNKIIVGIGSMLPDVLDKPIGSLFFQTGRWIGHAIFVQSILFLIFYYLFREKELHSIQVRKMLIIFYFSSIGHLALDFPGISKEVVFWPVFGSFPVGNRSDFLRGFGSASTVIMEITGIIVLIFVAVREKWEKQYWLLLFGLILVYLSLFLIFYAILVGW